MEKPVLMVGNSLEMLRMMNSNSVDAVVTDPPAGIGFMGKAWDSAKGGRAKWVAWLAEILAEVHRVLKPGGHGLVWAIPRTSHWTATACEDAGFEIRDRVSHLFGTGFPKSMNVGKAIDKKLGVSEALDSDPNRRIFTGQATAQARQWEGWGTALKPAMEDWWLVRKPLVGTVATNVLEHGTGGLNIDGCRIGTSKQVPASAKTVGASSHTVSLPGTSEGSGHDPNVGRWPAHLVLGPDAAAMLDRQAGPSKSTKGKPRKGQAGDGYGMTHTGAEYEDSGGPSRFFYVAKPTKKEKSAGLAEAGISPKSGGEATGRKDGSKGLDNPRSGAGRGGGALNHHPTVKGVALMRWLIRLITPPGGIVLDPFAGSGTTGVAAVAEGASFIGIEIGEDYAGIARARLEHAWKERHGK